MFKKIMAFILCYTIIFIFTSNTYSATATTTFTVTASVTDACSIVGNILAFGNYNPTSAAVLDNTTTLVVTCTNGTTYNVGLDAGTGSSSTVSNRKMTRIVGGT